MYKYIYTLIVILFSMTAYSQSTEFHWGVGLGMMNIDNNWAAGVNVAPRLNLASLSESATIGVGMKPGVYFWDRNVEEIISPDETLSFKESRFGYEIPVYLMFNQGRASSYISTESAGVFCGAGFTYSSITVSPELEEREDYELKSSGPAIILGLRFQAGKGTMGVNISKTFGKGDDSGLDNLNIRIMYYFGDY